MQVGVIMVHLLFEGWDHDQGATDNIYTSVIQSAPVCK